jgi:hypothetical protein
MRFMSRFVAAVALLAGSANAADYYAETWDYGTLEDWSVVGSTAVGAHQAAGGNPNGYALLSNTSSDIIQFTSDRPELAGDLAAAGISSVTVDLYRSTTPAAEARLRFTTVGDTGLVCGWRCTITYIQSSSWETYTLEFDPTWSDAEAQAAGWYAGPTTVASFADTMSNVIEAGLQFYGSGTTEVGVDNFTYVPDGAEQCAYRNWNSLADTFAGAFGNNVIVADDIQVVAGAEGAEIVGVAVDLMSWAPNGTNFDLYLYDDNPADGLPGALLGSADLGYVGYGVRDTVSVPLTGIHVPNDGFLWMAVGSDTNGGGWFIADQPALIGFSDDTFALDQGTGFEYVDFGPDIMSNFHLQLYVAEPPVLCPADVNGDGAVDVLDLLALLSAWGNTSGPEDINGDGIVDVLDLLELLSSWGPC